MPGVGSKVGEAYVEISARNARLKSGLRQSEGMVRNFASKARGLLAFGGVAGGAALFSGMVRGAFTFQDAMARVGTMLDRESLPMLKNYTREVRRISDAWGEPTEALAAGLYDILSAGVKTSEAIAVLETATRAARAGFVDTALTADVVTTVLNSWGMEAREAAHVFDIMFAGVKAGKTTMAELGANLGNVTSTAAMAKISVEETVGAIAAMTAAGVDTSTAVTALNAIIMGFLKPADEAVMRARSLGFEMSSVTLAADGLYGTLKKMEGLTPEMLAELFPNVRAIRGLTPLLNNMQKFAETLATVKFPEGQGQQQLNVALDTNASRWRQWGNEAKNALRTVGGEATDVIFGLDQGLRDLDRWLIRGTWSDVIPTVERPNPPGFGAAWEPGRKSISDKMRDAGLLPPKFESELAKEIYESMRNPLWGLVDPRNPKMIAAANRRAAELERLSRGEPGDHQLLWPRPIPEAARVGPSPYADRLREMRRDEIAAAAEIHQARLRLQGRELDAEISAIAAAKTQRLQEIYDEEQEDKVAFDGKIEHLAGYYKRARYMAEERARLDIEAVREEYAERDRLATKAWLDGINRERAANLARQRMEEERDKAAKESLARQALAAADQRKAEIARANYQISRGMFGGAMATGAEAGALARLQMNTAAFPRVTTGTSPEQEALRIQQEEARTLKRIEELLKKMKDEGQAIFG